MAWLALWGLGCGQAGGDRVCVPGATQSCLCAGGTQGAQVCSSDGSRFDKCECAGAAATPAAQAPGSARAANAESSNSAPKPAGSELSRIEDSLRNAIDDDLAFRIRSATHPTGKGGSLQDKSVSCVGGVCRATIVLGWQGGVLGNDYTTTVEWTVQADGSSTANIESETSIIEADSQHIAAMKRMLEGIARRF